MNATETKNLLSHIEVSYESIPRPPRFTAKSVELWQRSLSDIAYSDASFALSAWVLEERWPPTIADIRAKVNNLKSPADTMASQAWDQLVRELRKAYSPEGEQVWNSLPEATRLIVGGYATFRSWANTDTNSLESVQRPMFIKRFEELQARKRKENAIPERLREPAPEIPMERKEAMIEEKQAVAQQIPAPKDKLEELRKRLGRGV